MSGTITPRHCRQATHVARAAFVALLTIGGPAACAPPPEPDAAAAEADVTFEDERRVDLTGDGRDERVHVAGRGPEYDRLDVRLAIYSPGDSLLYMDRWHSSFYFEHEPDAALLADTAVQRIVRGHLAALLRDTAFARPAADDGAAAPRAVPPDPDAVRFDLAEHTWRRSNQVPDTARLPAGAFDEITRLVIPQSDVDALVAELAYRPSFTYHAGGEVVYTVAWSAVERRFVRMRSCC